MSDLHSLIARAERLLERLEGLVPSGAAHIDWDVVHAARWRRAGLVGSLQPVVKSSSARLDDLRCVDRQKREMDVNTRQFLAGLPANNALLWGPRGTGKSSLVKALLNEYAPRGLRLIEVEKDHLHDLPDIVAPLLGRNERYIVFCDDLSFERDDASYKALKTVLDGSVASQPDNVIVYATSNRRHLLPEKLSDNLEARNVDGEIHHGESVEERISLSERFGLWLSFHPFTQDQYLEIVRYWLAHLGVEDGDPEACRTAALQWALAHGSRSGRSAWQFAKDWAGKRGLEKAPSGG